MDDSFSLIVYSASEFIAVILGLIGLAFVLVGAIKLHKTKATPWSSTLLIAILASIFISIGEWLVIDLVAEPSALHVLVAESIFLILASILFLVACIAIFKLANHVSKHEQK